MRVGKRKERHKKVRKNIKNHSSQPAADTNSFYSIHLALNPDHFSNSCWEKEFPHHGATTIMLLVKTLFLEWSEMFGYTKNSTLCHDQRVQSWGHQIGGTFPYVSAVKFHIALRNNRCPCTIQHQLLSNSGISVWLIMWVLMVTGCTKLKVGGSQYILQNNTYSVLLHLYFICNIMIVSLQNI